MAATRQCGEDDAVDQEQDRSSMLVVVQRRDSPRFGSLSNNGVSGGGNFDSAYNSEESSPTLISPIRCACCRTIPALVEQRRRLPCGHFFCVPCSTSSTPDHSLTLYCPVCLDQSIAPFENEDPTLRNYRFIEYQRQLPIMLANGLDTTGGGDAEAGGRHEAKEAWTRLQTFSEACRRRIDDVDRHRRLHSPTRSSDTVSNISEWEELEESLSAVVSLLQRQDESDRSKRILGDLRSYETRLQNLLSRLHSSDDVSPEEGETWRRSFADAKSILRTLSTRAKLESQRLDNDDNDAPPRTRKPLVALIHANGVNKASTSTAVPPWTISVNGEGSSRCRRGIKNTLIVTAKNGNGDPVHLDRSHLSAYIVSTSSGKRVAVVAVREKATQGTYELSYYVNREGSYQLIVKFAGQHIGGSPFPIQCIADEMNGGGAGGKYRHPNGTNSACSVHSSGPLSGSRAASGSSGGFGGRGGGGSSIAFGRRTATTSGGGDRSRTQSQSPSHRRAAPPIEDDMIALYGSHGRGYGQFSNPQGICCTSDGRVIVADSNNQCVQVFDSQTGECKLRFGKRGRTAGEMQRPTGVAVLPSSGNILVADYDNRWISVHDPQGKYLGRFGAGKLLGPRGIAVDRDDHVILVDNKASVVLVYDLHRLKYSHQFGSRGDRLEQLAGPHYCAVNPTTNYLYLTDFHHHCVKVFDCRGQFQFSFGSLGEGNGQFQAPTGIAIDANQNVLVADWGNSRIQVFDQSGSFLSYVNSAAHPLFGPQGIAMTPDGNVAVSDTGNHCYKLYRFLS